MAEFQGCFMSKTLGVETNIYVYLPHDDEKYHNNQSPMKTLILLHGYSGNQFNWRRYTSLERYASKHNMAIICPDGGVSMFADMVYGQKYFEFISTELISIINQFFKIPTDRDNLFIGGLSMGGYGALKAALTYPERFSKCVAFSSGIMLGMPDFVKQINEYKVGYMIGAFGTSAEYESANNLFYLADKLDVNIAPTILLTCGKQDDLYAINQQFYQHLISKNIPTEWKEWDGNHEWDFWDESLRIAIKEFL